MNDSCLTRRELLLLAGVTSLSGMPTGRSRAAAPGKESRGPLLQETTLVGGVAAVRFDFEDGALGCNVYREIQIIGQATHAV